MIGTAANQAGPLLCPAIRALYPLPIHGGLRQPLAYPRGAAAHVTSAVVTLPVGAPTGWHRHDVPVFGYVLKGELTVAYRGRGERVFRAGGAFMEAVGTPHNGRNTGTGPMDILVVYIGADGVPNSVRTE